MVLVIYSLHLWSSTTCPFTFCSPVKIFISLQSCQEEQLHCILPAAGERFAVWQVWKAGHLGGPEGKFVFQILTIGDY